MGCYLLDCLSVSSLTMRMQVAPDKTLSCACRRCWSSHWTSRAHSYLRAQQGHDRRLYQVDESDDSRTCPSCRAAASLCVLLLYHGQSSKYAQGACVLLQGLIAQVMAGHLDPVVSQREMADRLTAQLHCSKLKHWCMQRPCTCR